MQLNEADKERTLRQLEDMFCEIPRKKIQGVCKQFGWKLEDCKNHLVNVAEKSENAVPISNGLPATWSSARFQFQNGAIPKTEGNMTSQKQVMNISKQKSGRIVNNTYLNNSSNGSDEQRIAELVSSGFRVMVLMRGAPGSGKSTLAKRLVEQNVPLSVDCTWKDFVLSTDDLFVDSTGRYNFSVERLSEMHNRNQRRAFEKAATGWSPIFVDNTNMQLWEMLPYAKAAILHSYIIEILEPKTPWSASAGKLAYKNNHGVSRDSIEMMLAKYERGSVRDLIKMVKNAKYTVPLPQMRMHPPVMISPQQDVETEEKFQVFENAPGQDSNQRNRVLTPLPIKVSETTPKEQRARNKPNVINKITDEKDFVGLLESTSHDLCWKPHEEEVAFFWGQSKDKVPDSVASREKKTLLDLLNEDTKEQQLNEKSMNKITNDSVETPAQHSMVIKHRMNCPNENEAFVSLRQIYPNKQPSGLWDLFVKCNGDVDWAVDILLKEDELSIGNDDYFAVASNVENEDALTCCCEIAIEESTFKPSSLQSISDAFSLLTTCDSKPQRQKNRLPRQNQRCNNAQPRQNQRFNSALNNVKETLEGIFVLGPEYYSEHVRKIRDTRNSVSQFGSTTTVYADAATQTDILDEEEPEHDDDGDLLELTLGDSLVNQLNGIFKSDTSTPSTLREDLSIKESPLKVFMPRTLAKEVYMLCMESTYNQIEENRQHMLHEDEDFARLLKIPKYENCQQSPSNIRELLDMELAWTIYNDDKKQELHQKQADKVAQPADLAAHLTHLKLCETFPDIPPKTLSDILAAHGNRFGETVEVLRSSITENDEPAVLTEEKLLQRAMCENEILKQQIDIETSPEHQQQQQQRQDESYAKSPVQPDEAKRVALRDFEETRNLAAHHCQLKAECYQKAKEAIQKGNNAVAVYYSQIANLHKKKIDMYNHRAANYIVAVHKYTQNNPDLLDLHYLHALEAIGCLDLFLDRHITVLRSVSRSYKHVFIITGRGLHSTGGVSTIKNKVKCRLKERNLRWSEVNPGLLKVKIFSASRHSKNII